MAPVVKELIAQAVASERDKWEARFVALEQRPVIHGRDGLPGRDGLVGPQGERGLMGERGEKGLDGIQGRDGMDGKDGAPGRDGIDGKDGAAGERGEKGEPGERGMNGKDGADGLNGKDGADGLGFEDMDLDVTDDGVFAKFTRGEIVKRWRLPIPADRGVYRDNEPYQAGDVVTYAGSAWIAREATSAKPGLSSAESRAWRLMVKRGNEGKPGPKGDSGERGPQGSKGDPGVSWR